jgi:predicted kinase
LARPTLVVVSGPPGSGKTTLAHELARAIPCPAVCRDEIKEGMFHAHGSGFEAAPNDPLTERTFPLFFDLLRMLLQAGVTVVAEAAFQDVRWRMGLEPLTELAELRIVHCRVPADVALGRRSLWEGKRRAHGDSVARVGAEAWKKNYDAFEPISLDAPSIEVDTSDGYSPEIRELVEFIARP